MSAGIDLFPPKRFYNKYQKNTEKYGKNTEKYPKFWKIREKIFIKILFKIRNIDFF